MPELPPEIDTSRPHTARMYDYYPDADEFADLMFGGLKLVPPGVVLVSEWRPGSRAPRPTPAEVGCYGGVARKP